MDLKRHSILSAILGGIAIVLSSLTLISQTQSQLQVVGPPLIPQPGKPGGSVRFALPSAPSSLNPLFSAQSPIIELIMSPLVQINRVARQIEPALATNYEFSADDKSITFHLRQGVQWSDGVPFTADDVIFSFQLYLNDQLQTILPLAADIKRQFQIEKIDNLTVNLTAPGPIPIDQLALVEILPQHKLGNVPINQLQQAWTSDTPIDQFAALGPFQIKAIKTSGGIFGVGAQISEIDLTRNPNFWQIDEQGQRLPYLDQLTIRFVSDGNQVLDLLKKGETDFQVLTYVIADGAGAVTQLQNAGFTVISTGSALPFLLTFNQDDPQLGAVFQDARFRQAVNFAIDRAQLGDQYPGKLATPALSFIHPLSLFYDPDHLVPSMNLDQAKTLLDEMGLKDTNGDGIREFNGQPVRFQLVIVQGSKGFAAVGQYLVQALSRVGLAVDLKPIPNEQYGTVFSRPAHFQAALFHPSESYDPSPSFNTNGRYYSQSNSHFYRFSDIGKKPEQLPATQQQVDALIQQLSNFLLTFEEKKQLTSQVGQVLVEDLPIIPLVRDAFTLAARSDVQNVQNLVPEDPSLGEIPLAWVLTYVWRGKGE